MGGSSSTPMWERKVKLEQGAVDPCLERGVVAWADQEAPWLLDLSIRGGSSHVSHSRSLGIQTPQTK